MHLFRKALPAPHFVNSCPLFFIPILSLTPHCNNSENGDSRFGERASEPLLRPPKGLKGRAGMGLSSASRAGHWFLPLGPISRRWLVLAPAPTEPTLLQFQAPAGVRFIHSVVNPTAVRTRGWKVLILSDRFPVWLKTTTCELLLLLSFICMPRPLREEWGTHVQAANTYLMKICWPRLQE